MNVKYVNENVKIFVKATCILLFTFSVFFVFSDRVLASTYDWEQTLFGSGITSSIEITTNSLTFSGGRYGYVYTLPMDGITGAYSNLTFISRTASFSDLIMTSFLPDTAYFLTRNTTGLLNTIPGDNTIVQQLANNTSTAYPQASAGFFGHIYFETDSNGSIVCWDVSANPGAGSFGIFQPFQECKRGFTLNFDLLGSTSPAMIISAVTDGVQTTGQQNWPLVALAGIPISFIIARRVLAFIKVAV